jgi:dephospho-CoA kinase
MLVVALTGGIGCGKSTVSRHLESFGIPVIDADVLAHRLVEPGTPALHEILETFGHHLSDEKGSLDRDALRNFIFNNPQQRKRLEAILHPRIREGMQAWISEQSAPYVVLVIPLLFETGQTDLADRVLVVDCDESKQMQRVAIRDDQSKTQIQQIIDAQVSRNTRLQGADDVLENNGDMETLLNSTRRIHQHYLKLASSSPTSKHHQ